MDCEEKKVEYQFQGKKGSSSLEKLLLKAFQFVSDYFNKTRGKLQFGAKVQSWFSKVEADIKDYKCKALHELIGLIAAYQPADLVGYKDEFEEDGDSADEDLPEDESEEED